MKNSRIRRKHTRSLKNPLFCTNRSSSAISKLNEPKPVHIHTHTRTHFFLRFKSSSSLLVIIVWLRVLSSYDIDGNTLLDEDITFLLNGFNCVSSLSLWYLLMFIFTSDERGIRIILLLKLSFFGLKHVNEFSGGFILLTRLGNRWWLN